MSLNPRKHLRQTATWWNSTPDNFGGHTYAAPVEILCRWEDRSERFESPLDRQEHISRAVVFLDRDIGVDDYLFLGVSGVANPTTVAGAFKVRGFAKIPNLRNLDMERRAYL